MEIPWGDGERNPRQTLWLVMDSPVMVHVGVYEAVIAEENVKCGILEEY